MQADFLDSQGSQRVKMTSYTIMTIECGEYNEITLKNNAGIENSCFGSVTRCCGVSGLRA